MDGSAPAIDTSRLPDPDILSRVVVIARNLDQALALRNSLPVSDERLPHLSQRIDLLRRDMNAALDADTTGMIRDSLRRLAMKGGSNG